MRRCRLNPRAQISYSERLGDVFESLGELQMAIHVGNHNLLNPPAAASYSLLLCSVVLACPRVR